MANKNKVNFSLEDIASNYRFVLIDTCALGEVSSRNIPKPVFEELKNYLMSSGLCNANEKDLLFLDKIKGHLVTKYSFRFWNKNILKDKKNCLITSGVFNELNNTESYNYKKKTKEKSENRPPHLTELRRSIRDENIERDRFLKLAKSGKIVMKLREKEKHLYHYFYNRYKELESTYSLHGADYPLLISGAVISETRGSSAIISNDSDLARAWGDFRKKANLTRGRFEFFTKPDISEFQKWK